MKSEYFKKEKENVSQGSSVKVSRFSLLNALEAVITPDKGKITYDEATNTLVITDTKPKIDKMGEINASIGSTVQNMEDQPKLSLTGERYRPE